MNYILDMLHTLFTTVLAGRDRLITLNAFGLWMFSSLCLDCMILYYLIHIICYMYGDYIIVRFQLKVKYSRLTRWIQFRRRLQSKDIKICFVIILVNLLPRMFANIYFIYLSLTMSLS